MKKARSAPPAPTAKDRLKESRRMAVSFYLHQNCIYCFYLQSVLGINIFSCGKLLQEVALGFRRLVNLRKVN